MNFKSFYDITFLTEAEIDPKDSDLIKIGKEIAKEIGVQFNGIYKNVDDSFHSFAFTDMETGSSFMGVDVKDAKEHLIAMRKRFKDVEDARV